MLLISRIQTIVFWNSEDSICQIFNHLLDDKILTLSKLKAFEDNKVNAIKIFNFSLID